MGFGLSGNGLVTLHRLVYRNNCFSPIIVFFSFLLRFGYINLLAPEQQDAILGARADYFISVFDWEHLAAAFPFNFN